MKKTISRLILAFLLLAGSAAAQVVTGGGSGGGVVGGTFGASPSSGYTFTSTPIATAPFSGNLLIGCSINSSAVGTLTAGAGYTLATTDNEIGIEYATGVAATSYSAPFTYSTTVTWGGSINAFTATNPIKVQANSAATVTALAYGSNNAAGNLLVFCVRYNTSQAGGPITSITDTNSNTWVSSGLRVPEAQSKGVGDGAFLEVWYAVNSVAGANTVTTHGLSGATGVHIGIAEFSGVATSSPLVDYNYGSVTVATTSFAGATTNTQYTINAVNSSTGAVDFTGRDSGAIFRSAANARASTGGLFFFKNGIYPGQTSLQESVAGQTNWYVWGIPAPIGTTAVSFHIVCESFTQILYSVLQSDGCVHLIMPSAYAGPAPSNTQLSGFWQRPNATFGSANNNADFFVNNLVRIPNNQVTPTVAFDTFTSIYSSHIGTVADSGIAAIDGTCSGLTPAVANITGFRTNQNGTDETYFENTWAVGFNTPYNFLSNHPVGINMHAVCGQNAGSVTIGASVYGGLFIHYQDLHNINGFTLNCLTAGSRIDFLNSITENIAGPFARAQQTTETNPGNCIGKIDQTTISFGVTPFDTFFAAGSGANFRVNESNRLIQPGLLNSNFTSAATTGTAKQTLATYTFVNNSQFGPFQKNPNGVFHIKAWGTALSNANSKVFDLSFGGTVVATITATINIADSVKCEADIIVSSVANTQEVIGYCDDGTTRTVTRSAPGITGNANIVLNVEGTTAGAAGDFTFKGLTIEYLGGQ
jgi:hypothetical protein